MKDVDLIIEAVIDDLQIKQDLFQRTFSALIHLLNVLLCYLYY